MTDTDTDTCRYCGRPNARGDHVAPDECGREWAAGHNAAHTARCYEWRALRAEKALAVAEARVPLAPKHTGMRVSASGILGRIAKGWGVDGSLRYGCEGMLEHLRELSRRYYAGDVAAVDEFLQIYCLDEGRAAAVAAQEAARADGGGGGDR
jgi:hypothetical protein